MNYFVIIISLILILLSFIRRNSKFLFFSLFLWMWILFAFNSSNADYGMYSGLFNGTVVGQHIDVGFKFLCSFFRAIGFNYTAFMALYSFIGLYLIGSTIYKYSKNVSLAAGLYFIFPFVFDVIQIRNFLAFAIVIYSLRFLENFKLKNIIIYISLVFIASFIHSFAIIGLLFPFLIKYKINILKVAILELLVVIFIRTKFFINLLFKFMAPSRVNAYFVSGLYSPGRKTLLAITIISILSIFVFWLIKDKTKNIKQKEYVYFYDLAFRLFVLSLFLIPVYQFNTVLTRFSRSILPLLYICISNIVKDKKANSIFKSTLYKKTVVGFISVFCIIFIWYQSFIFDIKNADNTIFAILNNNYILDMFKI